MEDVLTELRRLRKETSPIIRGNVPVVVHKFVQFPLLENIFFGVFTFIFSLVFGGMIFSFLFQIFIGIFLGLLLSIGLVCLVIFWPYFVIWKIKRETGKNPSGEILDHFGGRFDWLKEKIIRDGLVEMEFVNVKSDKPKEIHVTK